MVGSDFYLPAGARVLEAASRPEVVAAPDHDARVALLAELADVDPRWLEECLEGRPSFADVAGASALAVHDAARRRRVMRAAADAFKAASGGDLGDLERRLTEVESAA